MINPFISREEFERIYPLGSRISDCKNISNVYTSGDFVVKQYRELTNQGGKDLVLYYSNELSILSKFKHPNIVSMIATCPETLSFVFEKGVPILLRMNGSLSEKQLHKMFYELLTALEFLHENSVALIDIKPSNIIIVDGTAKFIDFGSSERCFKTTKGMMFSNEKRLYTPGFEPPEIECFMLGDIFALGKTFKCIDYAMDHITSNSFEELGVEKNLRSLISLMMQPIERRWTATQLLTHPLFEDFITEKNEGSVLSEPETTVVRDVSKYGISEGVWKNLARILIERFSPYHYINIFQAVRLVALLDELIQQLDFSELSSLFECICLVFEYKGSLGKHAPVFSRMVSHLNGILIPSHTWFSFAQNQEDAIQMVMASLEPNGVVYDRHKTIPLLDNKKENVNIIPNLKYVPSSACEMVEREEVIHEPYSMSDYEYKGKMSFMRFLPAHVLSYSLVYHNRGRLKDCATYYDFVYRLSHKRGVDYPPLERALSD